VGSPRQRPQRRFPKRRRAPDPARTRVPDSSAAHLHVGRQLRSEPSLADAGRPRDEHDSAPPMTELLELVMPSLVGAQKDPVLCDLNRVSDHAHTNDVADVAVAGTVGRPAKLTEPERSTLRSRAGDNGLRY
jgi:hypothetical protein